MMKMLAIAVSVLFALILGGCSTQPPAKVDLQSAQADAEAKSVMRLSDKAVVYLIRPADGFGNRDASLLSVSINTRDLGNLAADTYLKLTLNPGQYDFSGKGSLRAVRDANWRNAFSAGQTYFVTVGSKFVPLPWPGHGTVFFEPVDEVEGRRLLSRSKLARNALQDQAAESAKQKQYEAEALARLNNYEIFTAVSFSATVDSRYKGYSFGDLFSKARAQLQPKLEAASLKQLRNFEAIYGFELMPEDKALVKKLIAEKEQAQTVAAEPTSSKEVSPPRSQTRSSSSKTQPAKTDVLPRSATTESAKSGVTEGAAKTGSSA